MRIGTVYTGFMAGKTGRKGRGKSSSLVCSDKCKFYTFENEQGVS